MAGGDGNHKALVAEDSSSSEVMCASATLSTLHDRLPAIAMASLCIAVDEVVAAAASCVEVWPATVSTTRSSSSGSRAKWCSWCIMQVIGLAHILLHKSTWSKTHYCYLEDLYVDEQVIHLLWCHDD